MEPLRGKGYQLKKRLGEVVEWKLNFPADDACDGETCDACKVWGKGFHRKIKIEPEIEGIIRIFNECERSRSLPFPGGFLDQPSSMMKCFDIIRAEIKKHEDQKALQGDVDRIHLKNFEDIRSGTSGR